jgi:hypothetical protein
MKIDLLEIFKDLEHEVYCIIKSFDIVNYRKGGDIDIFCYDIKIFTQKILKVTNKYLKNGFVIKINNERSKHWHIDIIKDKKIEIRFDLYESMPNYQNIDVKESLFSSIIESRISENIRGIKIYKQSLLDETLLRYIEYIEYYKLRPDKVKHLDYILEKLEESNDRNFLDKLYFYTKLPQTLEIKKKNSKIDTIKDIYLKVKQTPLNELFKKILKNIKR